MLFKKKKNLIHKIPYLPTKKADKNITNKYDQQLEKEKDKKPKLMQLMKWKEN